MARSLPQAGSEPEPTLKRIWLVQPPFGGGPGEVSPPIGLLVLAAALEAEGREVFVVDQNLLAKQGKLDPDRSLRTQLGQTLPRDKGAMDLLGISTWSYNFGITMELVEEVRKRHRRVPIVLGGPHVTFVDRECLETFPGVDYVLRDEGDATLPLLLRAIERGRREEDLAAVPGLTWRRNKTVVRNPSGSVVEDLDALPYPAYHLIDPAEYLRLSPVLTVEAGRGCPYNCNFCSTTNMFQRKYRVKTPARLVDELEWAVGVTGSNRFELLHDNLVASKKYVRALCDEIRERNIDVSWSCTSRTDNITEEIAELMFLAGCDQVFFGIESLSEERQAWTGKRLKPPLIHEAIELTARQHILPTAGIIVGFPNETPEELDATVGAAVRWTTNPHIRAEVSTAVLRYYPGADLFQNASQLRYDPLAARLNAAVPGYELRKKWRERTTLFPLQSIHTTRDETRRNILRVQLIRTLMTICPNTFRACLDGLGIGARELLDRMAAGRTFKLFDQPHDTALLSNESVAALGDVLRATDSQPARELLGWEVPFWETRAVSPPLDHLEHVIHPRGYDQDDLLAWSRGEREGTPREASGWFTLGVRAGRECFVSLTRDPQAVLRSFQDKLGRLMRR